MEKQPVTLASLFDGIGGGPLSAVMCGAVPVWASEIEKFGIKVTQHHFPDMKHYGDITKIHGDQVEPVDILIGGSPCQDLSVAGKRAGLRHEDLGDEEYTRSGLFIEQVRIVKEMREACRKRNRESTNGSTEPIRPYALIWENVPGALSSSGGADFQAVLEEVCRIADESIRIPRPPEGWTNAGSILGDGFSVSWRITDAQLDWGVPQRRRRIYLLAVFEPDSPAFSAPAILFEREGMPWHLATRGTPWESASRPATGGAGGAIAVRTANTGANGWGVNFGVSHTLDLASGQAVLPFEVEGSRRAVAPTLTSYNLDSRSPQSEEQQRIVGAVLDARMEMYDNHPGDSRVVGPVDVAPTAASRWGTGGNNVPFVKMRRAQSDSDDETWGERDVAPTQNAFDQGDIRATTLAVDVYNGVIDGEVASSLLANSGGTNTAGPKLMECVQHPHPENRSAGFYTGNSAQSRSIGYAEEVSPTLKSDSGGNSIPGIITGAYPLDLRNASRDPEKKDKMNRQGCGVGEDGDACPTLSTMFVPGVAYSMATKQISQNIGIDIACPLCASDYKEPQVVMPGEAYNIREDSAKGNMSITPTDIHVCLQAQRSSDNSQHANTFILDPLQKTAGTLTPGAHPGSYNGQDAYSDLLIAEESPIGFNHLQDPVCMDERMPCIGAEGQAVVDNRNGTESTSVSPTLQSKPGGGFSPNCTPSVRMGMSVRRLTPLECERLQGFPDGWTDLPGSTDSSRFRALGNSFALPQAYFVISGCVDAIRRMREDGQ